MGYIYDPFTQPRKPFQDRLARERRGPTFSAAATLRTDSVAAPPFAANPVTPRLARELTEPGRALVPAVPSPAGARLSPATQDAYEPDQATKLRGHDGACRTTGACMVQLIG